MAHTGTVLSRVGGSFTPGALPSADLAFYQCGTEECEPGHSFGPAVRDHFLIHYVHSGSGIFSVGEKMHHIGKNEGFLIYPGTATFYKADDRRPWHYSWVGFNGAKAAEYLAEAGLDQEHPVFRYDKDSQLARLLAGIIDANARPAARSLRILGLLHLFLARLVEQQLVTVGHSRSENRKEHYFQKAVQYIGLNHSRKISVKQIADYIGIDRTYLYSIFKSILGKSPEDYLIAFRMTKACELMQDETLSIGDVSRSVGYEDPLLFSKMFKKYKYMSPSAYRKNHPPRTGLEGCL